MLYNRIKVSHIAYDLYKIIIGLRPEWAEKRVCDSEIALSDKDKKELKPIEKIKLVITRNKDDEPVLYEMLGTKEGAKRI